MNEIMDDRDLNYNVRTQKLSMFALVIDFGNTIGIGGGRFKLLSNGMRME